jgi:UDP-glucose 4-epimerase
MMRVVVTGASGFLGRALMRKLVRAKTEVVGVSRQNFPGLCRVANYADVPEGDVLVHLAEANDRRWVDLHGLEYMHDVLRTLTSLLQGRFQRVIYASSAVLYGDQGETPRTVEDPLQVTDTYTQIKYASEQLVLTAAGSGVVVRMVNLYGPGMAESNVLSTILKQLPLTGPVLVNDTTPIRDFLWIEDAAEAFASMVLGSAAGVFNLGTGKGTSIHGLARIALDVAGQPNRSIESERNQSKRSHVVVDVAHTTAVFGWRPTTALPQGINTLIDTIRKQSVT